MYLYQTFQKMPCDFDMSWSERLYQSVEKRSVWAHTTCCSLSNQWHFPQQQLRTATWRVVNNRVDTITAQLWKPPGKSEMTQRISNWSLAFPQQQRELAPAGLDCQTCRDAYWLTHCRRGVESWVAGAWIGQRTTSQHFVEHTDGCCTVKCLWRALTWQGRSVAFSVNCLPSCDTSRTLPVWTTHVKP